jgi:hypothetical protein
MASKTMSLGYHKKWYVEWEYATTIVGCGPFTAKQLWSYLKAAAKLMSESGYGEFLEAITIQDHP